MWARNEGYSRENLDSKFGYSVKEDESGLSSFPAYTGKIQENLLPVLFDEEEEIYKAKLIAEEIERKAVEDRSNLGGTNNPATLANSRDKYGNMITIRNNNKNGTTSGNTGDTKIVSSSKDKDMLWMPDKICKICYNCEDPFTIYRRRHHCRMCGQIFCDRCSSFYVDGSKMPNLGNGLHRSCSLCNELYISTENNKLKNSGGRVSSVDYSTTSVDINGFTRTNRKVSKDGKSHRHDTMNTNHKRLIHDTNNVTFEEDLPVCAAIENDSIKYQSLIQSRAQEQIDAIVSSLMEYTQLEKQIKNYIIKNKKNIIENDYNEENISFDDVDIEVKKQLIQWKANITKLCDAAVSNVDPDVRSGDVMDIRPYVKLKIIPGGSIDECSYIDGVIFRKNVSHKKMVTSSNEIILNPKILVLSGGIEFQRTDSKLSSMDTLIEQEDIYISILVEKIMYLKPDIILTGKAVARRAQDLLCKNKVAVLQNVRLDLLERISRLTGATMLPSTDHMLQHYNVDCLFLL